MRRRVQAAGFTYVEIAISIGLLCLLALGGATYMQSANQLGVSRRIAVAHDGLVQQIHRSASLSGALRQSYLLSAPPATFNTRFHDCVDSVPAAADCTNGAAGGGELQIFDPFTSTIRLTGGSPADPERYDLAGKHCVPAGAPASPDCPWEVWSTFVPLCPPNPLAAPPANLVPLATCRQAETIEISYTVKGAWVSGAPVATAKAIQDVTGTGFVRVKDISN